MIDLLRNVYNQIAIFMQPVCFIKTHAFAAIATDRLPLLARRKCFYACIKKTAQQVGGFFCAAKPLD
ncbi:hypothetical protein [Pontiella sulfatireligans]|uniref:hypothetical protein n=1 Tax=Pontiella sulfatireligans TaxID=2750658 RepID=UPI00109CD195|nr:hypothetical protein [Pontiella sulfatireligans]